jgi:hypothetical protein
LPKGSGICDKDSQEGARKREERRKKSANNGRPKQENLKMMKVDKLK